MYYNEPDKMWSPDEDFVSLSKRVGLSSQQAWKPDKKKKKKKQTSMCSSVLVPVL